jgi:hypothetical protein
VVIGESKTAQFGKYRALPVALVKKAWLVAVHACSCSLEKIALKLDPIQFNSKEKERD